MYRQSIMHFCGIPLACVNDLGLSFDRLQCLIRVSPLSVIPIHAVLDVIYKSQTN